MAETIEVFIHELEQFIPNVFVKLCMIYHGLPCQHRMRFQIDKWIPEKNLYLTEVQDISESCITIPFPVVDLVIHGKWSFHQDDYVSLQVLIYNYRWDWLTVAEFSPEARRDGNLNVYDFHYTYKDQFYIVDQIHVHHENLKRSIILKMSKSIKSINNICYSSIKLEKNLRDEEKCYMNKKNESIELRMLMYHRLDK